MNLKDYPLHKLHEAYKNSPSAFDDTINAILKELGLTTILETEGEQILTYIASNYKFIADPVEFLTHNLETQWDRGLHKLLTRVKRSNISKSKMTDAKMLPYCSLVPMYMAAFKKYKNVDYNAWSRNGLQHLVDDQLYKAMTVAEDHPARIMYTEHDDLMNARELALDGASASTTYRLKGVPEPFKNLPTLAKHMLFQTWCAHPINRNNYMILNPWNWDDIPAPLINENVIQQDVMPWDN